MRVSASSLVCTFGTESGSSTLCMYSQRLDDHFDWTRQKGATPSIGTGPDWDHTVRNERGNISVCVCLSACMCWYICCIYLSLFFPSVRLSVCRSMRMCIFCIVSPKVWGTNFISMFLLSVIPSTFCLLMPFVQLNT